MSWHSSFKTHHNHGGYTLIEVMMVVTLVAVLAAIGVSQYTDFRTDARNAVTLDALQQIKLAIIGNPKLFVQGRYSQPGFTADLGALPATLNELSAQGGYATYDPFTHLGWHGPYLPTDLAWLNDAWGTAIVYSSVAKTLKSCGPNMTCGDADDITVSF